MKCEYCDKPVYGEDGLTIPGKGVAHKTCFEIDKSSKRIFQTLDLSELEPTQLIDLKDLVLAEINERERGTDTDFDDIELF